MTKTRLSSKGQVIIPKAVRERTAGGPGSSSRLRTGAMPWCFGRPTPSRRRPSRRYAAASNMTARPLRRGDARSDRARGAPDVGGVRAAARVIAVDTNILVRYLVEDDVAQTDRAETVLRSGSVLLAKTVLLESEWVLRTHYRFERAAIEDGLPRLLGLPGIEVEDRPAGPALAWYGQGAGFYRRAPSRLEPASRRLRHVRSGAATPGPRARRSDPGHGPVSPEGDRPTSRQGCHAVTPALAEPGRIP